ncbi:MAG: aminotransferase class V-fold PLP-dependent enzyme, partial [Deltaproteobacteria bacterium]|nr:aminotransferase class V-fold PLP-dependent enzyme [Deltaproteobacteria bacterium]
MISQAVVLATSTAGTNRLGPLTPVGDCSLLKRALSGIEEQGVHEFIVVLDEGADLVRQSIESDADITARITWVEQPRGASPLHGLTAARAHIDAPVLALHANLLFSPGMVGPLLDVDRRAARPTLLVDFKLRRLYDSDALLQVRTDADRVAAVGFDVAEHDAVAVGMSVLTPALLDELIASQDDSGSLVELLRPFVAAGQFYAWDINGALWQQVHNEETLRHGEWMLRAYGEMLHDDSAPPATLRRDAPDRTLSYIEGLLSDSRARHYVLMNPGPVLTSPGVKSALVHHDVCHRDEDYAVVTRRIRRKLRQVCRGGAEHDVMLISGSGTAAMEATISSCVPEDGKLLVVSNGAFGERFAEIAKVHKLSMVHLQYAWGELVDPADIQRALVDDASIGAVVMCHHETSVGILNPVNRVGAICHDLDRLFFVDAVSSLGAEDIDVRRDKIDVLISSANKCLHAISGISFVCVDQRVWGRIDDIDPRSYYLDLHRYHDNPIPFTPAVSNFFALDVALDELLREGIAQRMHRYRRLNSVLRRELRRLGLDRFSLTGHESHTITTLKVPEFISFGDLYQALKDRGYIVYGCKASLKDQYFQVANMGDLSDDHVRGFVESFAQVLSSAAVATATVSTAIGAPS